MCDERNEHGIKENADRVSYVVELSEIEEYADVHRAFRDSLGLPEHYGMNWDALWDCLTDMAVKPIFIEVRGFDEFERRFPASAVKLRRLLADFERETLGECEIR